jgi:hypothetical protein
MASTPTLPRVIGVARAHELLHRLAVTGREAEAMVW